MIVLGAQGFGASVVDLLWICLGVGISVVLPALSAFVFAQFSATAATVNFRKYLALAVFSLIVAIVALAIYRSQEPDEAIAWYTALLLGYGWQATLEKLTAGTG